MCVRGSQEGFDGGGGVRGSWEGLEGVGKG